MQFPQAYRYPYFDAAWNVSKCCKSENKHLSIKRVVSFDAKYFDSIKQAQIW